MKITDLLDPRSISLDATPTSKSETLDKAVELMAPHGGIFVFPVMGNPLFYLLALVVGTAISTVLLGVLKKNVEE